MRSGSIQTYGALAAGIAAVSFAAIFIRLANAQPLIVAALRMIFASLLLMPWAVASRDFRKEVRRISARDLAALALSGLFLAAHFFTWIASLSFTSVSNSVVLVATTPLFIAGYTILVRKERVAPSVWAGLTLAVIGTVWLTGGDLVTMGFHVKGDLLALLGAAAAAGYFLIGSRLRKSLSLVTYIFPVYAVSAIVLAAVAGVAGIPLGGCTVGCILYCFLLALVCQAFGHSLFNWTLRRLKPTVVTIAVLGEPVGATILALVILGEHPTVFGITGGVVIIAGISIVLYFNPALSGSPDARISPRQ
jgi:drug/metabolite transporter (DMT)-like permease